MIHFWRRLVLRHPVVNSPFNEEVWPLPKLHKLVAKTYALISPKSEAALSRPVNEQMRNARFNFKDKQKHQWLLRPFSHFE